MIIPVRCYSCNKIIGNNYIFDLEVKDDENQILKYKLFNYL